MKKLLLILISNLQLSSLDVRTRVNRGPRRRSRFPRGTGAASANQSNANRPHRLHVDCAIHVSLVVTQSMCNT